MNEQFVNASIKEDFTQSGWIQEEKEREREWEWEREKERVLLQKFSN